MPARPLSEPLADPRRLVRGVVVEDHMDGLVGWHLALDAVQEADELLMAMALHVLSDDRAVEHVEGGEQGGGAVTLVVVGDALDVAEPHGKQGLGAFEGLDLALLIDAEDDGTGRGST